jgi:hypothetical protein
VNLATSVRAVLNRAPQREAGPPEPIIIGAMADCQVLGRLRGRLWIKHDSREFQLGRAIPDRGPELLVAGRAYVTDSLESGELVYREARPFLAGSHANAGHRPSTAKAPRVKLLQRVDSLAGYPLFSARQESWSSAVLRPERDPVTLSSDSVLALQDPAASTPSMVRMFDDRPTAITSRTPARPRATGAAEMIERLARAKVRIELTPDKAHLTVITEGGALPVELREAIVAAAPLLVGHLSGTPLTCAWCPAVAVTLLLGGAPCCSTHSDEDLRP